MTHWKFKDLKTIIIVVELKESKGSKQPYNTDDYLAQSQRLWRGESHLLKKLETFLSTATRSPQSDDG